MVVSTLSAPLQVGGAAAVDQVSVRRGDSVTETRYLEGIKQAPRTVHTAPSPFKLLPVHPDRTFENVTCALVLAELVLSYTGARRNMGAPRCSDLLRARKTLPAAFPRPARLHPRPASRRIHAL